MKYQRRFSGKLFAAKSSRDHDGARLDQGISKRRYHESDEPRELRCSMNNWQENAIAYFNRWFADPIGLSGTESVSATMEALNEHPLSSDETAQDYIVPPARYEEMAGRFRILGENQDVWHCFVATGTEMRLDPSVFFESCLDLRQDYLFGDDEIIEGDFVRVGPFRRFLWTVLGRHICLRGEGSEFHLPGVQGIVFARGELSESIEDSYFNPLGHPFPDGYTCYFSEDTICIPDWGAAFLHDEARERFMGRFAPLAGSTWSR